MNEKEKTFELMFLLHKRPRVEELIDEFLSGNINAFTFTESFGETVNSQAEKDKFQRMLENSDSRNIVLEPVRRAIINGESEEFQILISKIEDLVLKFLNDLQLEIEKDNSLFNFDLANEPPYSIQQVASEMKRDIARIYSQ